MCQHCVGDATLQAEVKPKRMLQQLLSIAEQRLLADPTEPRARACCSAALDSATPCRPVRLPATGAKAAGGGSSSNLGLGMPLHAHVFKRRYTAAKDVGALDVQPRNLANGTCAR